MTSAFKEKFRNRHQIGRQWKARGKKVYGYFYSLVPKELIHAAGMLPVQIMEDSEGDYDSKAELESFICGFGRNCTGQAVHGQYDYLDGVAIVTVCDTNRHLYDIWKRRVNIPHLTLLGSPATSSPSAKKYYAVEMGRFRDALGEIGGVKVTDDMVRSSIQLYNENRALMRQLYEMRENDSLKITGGSALDVVKAGLVISPEEHSQMLTELLKAPHESGQAKGGVRLMLCAVNFNIAERVTKIIEDFGSSVVTDDFAYGIRYFSHHIDADGDPIASLVEGYLGRIPTPGYYPFKQKAHHIMEVCQKTRADGIVYVIQQYCDAYNLEYPMILERLKGTTIPVLKVETEDTEAAAEHMKTRIQSFIESLS